MRKKILFLKKTDYRRKSIYKNNIKRDKRCTITIHFSKMGEGDWRKKEKDKKRRICKKNKAGKMQASNKDENQN